ncbi:transglutaminase domain-containing protein [Petrimonas sulfuriphila]|uniref:transglutaminase domain-containing protein n=1 Tax=Petrimonas sulfuriphila TaxID=285070 RepID=UPI00324BB522
MKYIIRFSVFSLILLCSCIGKKQSELEQALLLAGDNRAELEKVLKRYSTDPADSLKYRAACFLIENMPGYHYYEGEALEKYADYFKLLGEDKKTPDQILDSLHGVYGPFDTSTLTLKFDIKEIDSTFLCENIDLAFKVWTEKPWGKNVTFDDFCEYILPYRTGNEKLTNWRKNYLEEYGTFAEGITTEDPVEAAIILRRNIIKKMRPERFTMTEPGGYPSLDAITAKYLTGSCDNINQFVLFLLRANGIPCATDYMPLKSYVNVGHSWVSLKNKKNEYYAIDYFGDITYISGTELNRRTAKPKVYRKTFSMNTSRFNLLSRKSKAVPREFSKYNYRFYDVTGLYSNHLTDLSIPKNLIYKDKSKNTKVFYLCILSKMNWVPIDWTDAYKKGVVTFKNIDAGDIFRVAVYENDKFVFITDPFKLHNQTYKINLLENYESGSDKPFILYSKYSLEGEIHFRDRMVGGVFEGSDNPNFKNPDTLHIIKDRPFRLFHHVTLSSENRYRYVRYKGPEESFCNVAEIQFLSDTLLLRGKIIGTPGSWQNDGSHEYTNAFDGSTETSFDHNTPSDGWTGLDLGQPQRITEIVYSPRNHDNYIKKGDIYELFMSDRTGWSSMWVQIASSDSLRYENIPEGCLFYLKNHSGGVQERPFVIEDGKTVFL